MAAELAAASGVALARNTKAPVTAEPVANTVRRERRISWLSHGRAIISSML
jgi:hypothetical protein